MAPWLVGTLLVATASATPDFGWKQEEESLSLEHRGKPLWKFHVKAGRHKPFFHPLATLDGTVFTADKPADHVWHHGLWYSFKFLNGVNFWEEDPSSGLSDGITRVVAIRTSKKELSARFELEIAYENPQAEDPAQQKLIHEIRTIEVSAPDDLGTYTIDFAHHFQAVEDVVMDRTPLESEPNGKSWGGYAGFSLRQQKTDPSEEWNFLAPDAAVPTHGSRYRWLALVRQGGSSPAATAIFDHPRNPRHPAAWYIADKMPFYSPCFLFDSNWTLRKGDSFRQQYRLKVFSSAPKQSDLEAEWTRYTGAEKSTGHK